MWNTIYKGWQIFVAENSGNHHICLEKEIVHGWKDTTDGLKNLCNESADFEKVVEFINKGTFKHDDLIEHYTS